MNAAVLIASRELRDRGRFFLIAAAMSVIPFIAVFAVRENRSLAIATVAGFVAAAYTCGLALAMGVSMIGSDLTEKRLSFLFSKPVSAASIWFGKVAGGILTWLGAFAIVIAPTYLFAHRGWNDMWASGGGAIAAYTLIMSTALFFASHAASTILRSRSALVAVDFALLVVMVIALFGMMRPILLGGGLGLVIRMVVVIALALLVILAIAPVWQIARGRIDPRRNHAALSTAFWSGTAIVVIAAAAFSMWVISPSLGSMTNVFTVDQSPSGDWIYISGQTENRGEYLASFLVKPATGERERVPVSPWSNVHRTPDGKSLVWMQYDDLLPNRGSFRFYTRSFEPGAKAVATPLVMGMPRNVQLSRDGSRVAVTRSKRLEVYELATGRLLGAAPGIEGDVAAMYFAQPDIVRIVEVKRGAQQTMVLREFDMKHRRMSSTPSRPAKGSYGAHFNEDGSRVYMRAEGAVLDARTGAVLFTQSVKPERYPFGAMLRDGSSVVAREGTLYHYDVNGALVAEMAIPAKRAGITAQIGTSKVVLTSGGNNEKDWKTFVVDLKARKVGALAPGVRGGYVWWYEPVLPQFTDDATIAVMGGGRKLALWDVRTGAIRPFPS